MKYYGENIAARGGTDFFEVKSLTLSEEAAKLLNTNYVHQTFPDYVSEDSIDVPEIHGDLADLNSAEMISADLPGEIEDGALSDEDIADAFTNIVRNELKSELIALEEEEQEPEEETDNNQTTQTKDDDFEWF
jgi:hypothetical protein